jgi:hypothetical protein
MSRVISMYRPGDPRQTAVILCLMAPRFEHSTLIERAKQHKHSAIAACLLTKLIWIDVPPCLFP